MTTPLTDDEADFLANLASLHPETRAAFIHLMGRISAAQDFSISDQTPVAEQCGRAQTHGLTGN